MFAGAGVWHPDEVTLDRIRSKIVEKPEKWRSILVNSALTARHEQAGESLKRAPRGFDPEHPLIAEIKRKDYLCVQKLSQAQACRAGFLEEFAASCKAAAPFVRFLTEAVGQEF